MFGGVCSFNKAKRNSNSFDATKLFPTPKQNETAQQIASNIETMKQMLSKSKEALEISEKNWNEIIAEFEIISTDNKSIIAQLSLHKENGPEAKFPPDKLRELRGCDYRGLQIIGK